jgi:DNA-binding response OmpR family regulator
VPHLGSSVSVPEITRLLPRARLVVLYCRAGVRRACRSIRDLRSLGVGSPLLLIAPKAGSKARATFIEAGANDAVGSLCSDRELLARAYSLGLRDPQTLHVGPIRMDLGQHSVTVADRRIRLTATEYHLLAYLMRRPHRVVTTRELMEAVLGVAYQAHSSTVRKHLLHLRRKLAISGIIETVSPRSYRLRTIR